MHKLIRTLLRIAGYHGHWFAKHGPAITGTAHTQGVRVNEEDEPDTVGTVELDCQPGDNKSRRTMWLHVQHGYPKKEVIAKLKKAAENMNWPPTKNKKRRKSEPKISFKEQLALAVPEGDDRTMTPDNTTGNTTVSQETAGAEEKKTKYAGSPADDLNWVRRAVEVFLAATNGGKVMRAEQFGKTLREALNPELPADSFRGPVIALINRGYWKRLHFQDNPEKPVSAYELTDKGIDLLGGEVKNDEVAKRRLDKLAEQEKIAAPVIELEKKLAIEEKTVLRLTAELRSHEEEVGRIKAEIVSQPAEVKRARDLLKLLE